MVNILLISLPFLNFQLIESRYIESISQENRANKNKITESLNNTATRLTIYTLIIYGKLTDEGSLKLYVPRWRKLWPCWMQPGPWMPALIPANPPPGFRVQKVNLVMISLHQFYRVAGFQEQIWFQFHGQWYLL